MSKSTSLVGATSATLIVSGLMLAMPLTGWAQFEEMVVTTRKKEENIQDVPIAVDAISAQEIARRGLSNVADIVKLSTSVQFDQSFGPQDTRIAIRGLSNTRGRSNVAFLVDGVDVTTENFISAGSGLLANQRLLTDVERVEIIKGPQSALYGRAAFAGAISYTTKEPGDEFESKVRLEAGNYGVRQLDGSISGPVTGLEDLLGFRWTGATWASDGFYTNATTGQDMGAEDGWGTALTMVLTPGDDIKIKLRTEYSDSKVGQRPNVRLGGGTRGRTGAEGFDGLTFFPYPKDPIIIQGPSNTTTRLRDFGEYCPETAPDQGSEFGGICAVGSYGSASGLQPAVDVDPVTGADYRGTDTQLWRTSLNASIDYDYGTFSLITGWTDYNAFDELDQDYQVAPLGNEWSAGQQAQSDLQTDQFSTELRFSSNFEGPVNFTLGGMYWKEERAQDDLNFIVSCVEYGKAGSGNVFPDPDVFVSGICDGTNGTIDDWQQRVLDFFPCQYDAQGNPIPDPAGVDNCLKGPRTPAPWRATTEHWSAYFNLTWDLSDRFQLILENRYVDESFEILRPSFSSCTNLFFAFGTGNAVRANGDREGVVNTAADDIVCTNEARMNPNIPQDVNAQNGDWMLIEGTEKSSFNTPKVTLNWKPTDNSLYYFSWGKGIKPGGINTLAAGGSPTTIDDERFLPEEVQAWEFGAKTDWEVAGFLQANGSLFLNDYTDKQVGTQVVDENDSLQPRVVNAASAEVWGVEVELAWQPDFLDGLFISASYTYLDAKFNDFTDLTRSFIRAALAGDCPVVAFDSDGNSLDPDTVPSSRRFCALDLSGNQLERTPENAFVGNVQYEAAFLDTGFDWFVEANAAFQDERFLDVENVSKFDEYWLVDTRIGLSGETFEFLVYVDNLLADDTIRTGGSGPDFAKQVTELGFTAGLGASHNFGLLPPPRTVGARITMRF
ncbi:MAG: TonB-dependent receptor [Gammaproteobacteria bacterium]|nr:TonB-dependent receptor [Gammaproteobacteria bacterium]